MTNKLPLRTRDIKVEDLPQVQRLPAGTPLDDIVRALCHAGGVIIEGLYSVEDMEKLESEIRPILDKDVSWEGNFFPPETRRCEVLVSRSPAAADCILGNDLLWELSRAFLEEVNWYWYGEEKQWSRAEPQLNTSIAFSVGPGAGNQPLHRDDHCHHNNMTEIDDYPIHELQKRETLLGQFFAVKKTTMENGATRFIPGSHLWGKDREPSDHLAYYAEMNPGDSFFMLGSCYHGGSANKTNGERLVVGVFTAKGYYRQEENQYLGIPMELIRSWPVPYRRRVGYYVSQPWCGHVFNKDPLFVTDPELFGKNLASDLFGTAKIEPYKLAT